MTVTYQKNVSNTSFMGFAKLLLKWKGSIYKLVFKELLLYGAAFAAISLYYRIYMSEDMKRRFEKVALYLDQTSGMIPLSFVLGFYVTFVVTRWWNQFLNIPWPDKIAHAITMYVNGMDERGRILRRTLIRYINLANIILFQTISEAVKKRFPTSTHLVEAGLMTFEEKLMFDSVKLSVNKHFVPLIWYINLINVAVKEGRIQPGAPVKQLLEEMNSLRTKTSHLWGHDWVTVPLVYTQVVTLLTHLFFITCLVGRQFLDPAQGYPGHNIDIYFPIYTFLQFFFFLGWLKVAEQLINPFGEDDDDFETNYIIDRNIQVSYTIVDDLYGKLAKLERDRHWGSLTPELPYTEAALVHKIASYKGSTMQMVAPSKEQTVVFHNLDHTPSVDYRPNRIQETLSRCCCGYAFSPPLNKPLGESYNRPEPMNYEAYDRSALKRGSNYSIFGENYFTLVNRGGKRDSVISNAEAGLLGGNDALTTTNYTALKRHRPSMASAHVLSSVCETEQEEAESLTSSANTEAVKAALTFLDEDLEEVTEEN